MATSKATQSDTEAETKAETGTPAMSWDKQRLDDEMKDRERLRAERVEYDAEKIAALTTERQKLIDDFNSQTHDRYVEFMKKRAELDVALGRAGGNLPHPSLEPFPTNETMADGTPRARMKIA